MYKRKRQRMIYEICVPPVTKNLSEYTKEEAADYFDWYMKAIPSRISYLTEVCSQALKCDKSLFDCSPVSLRLIWKWFLTAVKTESDDDSDNHEHFTLQSEYIMRDIGMYLGEVFVRSYETVSWDYYTEPKSDMFVNKPLLKGFKDKCVTPPFDAVFEPIHMTRVQASRIFDGRQSDDDLYNVYMRWEKMIQK